MREGMLTATSELIPDGLVEDILISTNSITDLMQDEVNKAMRTILYILESNWPIEKNDEGRPKYKSARDDPKYGMCRKAILDGFNDYNRFMIFRIMNPIFDQHNGSVESLHDRITELENCRPGSD